MNAFQGPEVGEEGVDPIARAIDGDRLEAEVVTEVDVVDGDNRFFEFVLQDR